MCSINRSGKSTVRIAPLLVITEELLMRAIDIIEKSVELVNH